ncbi:MAG: hypothetical protein H8D23_25290 [Candidatus Brocadiales bacterium]|nr:hypothetical protein [Candidatus Brocadiales bacterium]
MAFEGKEQRRKPRTLVSKISYERFGKASYVNTAQVIAGTGVTILVHSNPNRISMLLINNSDSDVYVHYTPDVSADYCFVLAANGGTFSTKVDDEGEMVIHELYAVSGSAARNCTLIESLLQED